jgi:hypothetical protein
MGVSESRFRRLLPQPQIADHFLIATHVDPSQVIEKAPTIAHHP